MEFKLKTAEGTYTEKDAKQMEVLKELGFVFVEGYRPNLITIKLNPTINIETLQDLLNLQEKVGNSLVIDSECITIYNGRLE